MQPHNMNYSTTSSMRQIRRKKVIRNTEIHARNHALQDTWKKNTEELLESELREKYYDMVNNEYEALSHRYKCILRDSDKQKHINRITNKLVQEHLDRSNPPFPDNSDKNGPLILSNPNEEAEIRERNKLPKHLLENKSSTLLMFDKLNSALGGKPISPNVPLNTGGIMSERDKALLDSANIMTAKKAGSNQPWTIKARIKAKQLPTEGKIRYVPPPKYNPSVPLMKGPKGGILDRFRNEWIKGCLLYTSPSPRDS